MPQLAHLGFDGARNDAEATADAAAVTEHEVLGDREPGDEPELLVHHADARVDRLTRRCEVDPPAVEGDRALVGAVQAGEDVRQRRLPGAVLAQQRVHLAQRRIEVDPVVCDDPGEPLRDAPHRDGRGLRCRHRSSRA